MTLRWASPGWLAALVAAHVGHSLAPAVIAVATGRVVAALGQPYRAWLWWLVVLCVALVLQVGLNNTVEVFNRVVGRQVDAQVRSRVRRSLAAMPSLEVAESAEVLDDAALASTSSGPNGYQQSVGSGAFGQLMDLFNAAGIVAACVVVMSSNWVLGLVLMVLLLLLREWRLRLSMRGDDSAAIESSGKRRSSYFAELAAAPAAAKEVRAFGWGDWVLDRFDREALGWLRPVWQQRRASLRAQAGFAMMMAVTAVLVFAGPAWLGWTGRVAPGQVMAMVVAGIGAFRLMWPAFGVHLAVFATSALDALRRLEARAGTAAHRSTTPDGHLRVEGLDFGYGDGPTVLHDFNLDLAPGEVVGVVGINGAGKTTLAKLLAGLYQPRAGKVSWPAAADGRPTQVSVLFSTFNRYPLTLVENVAMGDEIDRDAVVEALTLASASDLVPQLDTLLTKTQTGGVDLSGGQWQKVALARCIYAVRGGRRLLIMDEPTSHLDATVEAEFYDKVVRALAGTTIVLISHRLSTLRSADRIVLIDDGRVAEQGSHAELMAAGGHYAQLFRLQASRFEETAS